MERARMWQRLKEWIDQGLMLPVDPWQSRLMMDAMTRRPLVLPAPVPRIRRELQQVICVDMASGRDVSMYRCQRCSFFSTSLDAMATHAVRHHSFPEDLGDLVP